MKNHQTIYKYALLLFAVFCLQMAEAQDVKEKSLLDCQLLTKVDNLPSTDGQLLVLPDLGLFYLDNGQLYSLDSKKSPTLEQFRFKDNFSFDQLIVNDSTFLVKSQQYVLQIDADKTKMVTELDTDVFDIYSGHDGKYNMVVQEDSALWAWYSCDLKTQKTECVVRMAEPISLIYDASAAKFCVVGNRIYMPIDESIALLTDAEEPVLDLVITKVGVLFCTEHTLYCINADDMQADIYATGRFHSLYYDNGTLYLVLQNGDIMKTDL